jgi:hypothetical protein
MMNLRRFALGIFTVTAAGLVSTRRRAKRQQHDSVGSTESRSPTTKSSSSRPGRSHIKAAAADRRTDDIDLGSARARREVECLDCIPSIRPLLYDGNARTRKIAVVATPQDAQRRNEARAESEALALRTLAGDASR